MLFFLLLLLLFSSTLSFKSIYWLPIGCRSILLKPISFMFLGLCFSVTSPQDCFPLTDWLEQAGTGSMFKIPLSCPSSANDSSTLPRGNSSIMAGCLTGRGLMTGALYWPGCHTLKIWSQPSFLKPVQLLPRCSFWNSVFNVPRFKCSRHRKQHVHANDVMKDEDKHNGKWILSGILRVPWL